MGANPALTASPMADIQIPPAVANVQGTQIVNIPAYDPGRSIANPIYVGSIPQTSADSSKQNATVSMAAPGFALPTDNGPTPPWGLSQGMSAQSKSAVAGQGFSLPSDEGLPTPPWMLFQQNAVRIPQQNTAPSLPLANQQPQMPQSPSSQPIANNSQTGQVPASPLPIPQQGKAPAQESMPPQANPEQQPANKPAQQIPPQKQPPQPGPEKQPETAPQQGKKAPQKEEPSPVSQMQDDAMSQDTIRSLNSRMSNSVSSVRVAAAGDFLTLMVSNPDLTNNPRFHLIIDAFLEKMLKDPSADVRAAAYRSLESANITKVSPGVYELLKQRGENDGVFGVETDSINTILAGLQVETPPKEDSKDAKAEAKKASKSNSHTQEKH